MDKITGEPIMVKVEKTEHKCLKLSGDYVLDYFRSFDVEILGAIPREKLAGFEKLCLNGYPGRAGVVDLEIAVNSAAAEKERTGKKPLVEVLLAELRKTSRRLVEAAAKSHEAQADATSIDELVVGFERVVTLREVERDAAEHK